MNVLAHRIPSGAHARRGSTPDAPRRFALRGAALRGVVPRTVWIFGCSMVATIGVMAGLERLAERIG